MHVVVGGRAGGLNQYPHMGCASTRGATCVQGAVIGKVGSEAFRVEVCHQFQCFPLPICEVGELGVEGRSGVGEVTTKIWWKFARELALVIGFGWESMSESDGKGGVGWSGAGWDGVKFGRDERDHAVAVVIKNNHLER